MLSFGLILTIVDVIITASIMMSVLEALGSVKFVRLRVLLFKSLNNPLIAFLLNFAISNILAYFTGGGMVSGLANLLSSVLVGIFLPMYTRNRYSAFMDFPVCPYCGKKIKGKKCKSCGSVLSENTHSSKCTVS